MTTCDVDGCDRRKKARGLCQTHYARWRKSGDPGAGQIRVARYDGPCSVDGCESPARSRGWCPTHYARVLRHGDAGEAALHHAVSYDKATCSAPDCNRRPRSRGYCLVHYKRLRRWGDPEVKRPTRPPMERFLASVVAGSAPAERPGLGPCHLWTGRRTSTGYGSFSIRKEQFLAHRWIYAQTVGAVPDGLVLDHLCRVRHCINPQHLEPVTNEENLRRGAGYGLQNGMRSTCINGHEYTPDNTYTAPDGGIRCRKCQRNSDRGRSRRKAA